MKKLVKIISAVLATMLLVSAMMTFTFAEDDKSYTYTLDFGNLLSEDDYFEVFKSEWNNDYAQIAAKRVDFNEVKSGSGPHSKNVGFGIGFGTSECRVYKCVTDKKCYFENDNKGYTTVFKFTAPVKGTYSTLINIPEVTGALTNTNIFYFIGNDAEGLVMNTEGGTTQGRHDFTHAALEGKYRMTFELEKGESIAMCILAWSNMIYQVDEISVTLTNAAEEPPVVTTTPEETTTKKDEQTSADDTDETDDKGSSTPVTTEDKNDGGDKDNDNILTIVLIAVAAVAVIAVVIVVVAKKKK